MRLVPPWLLSRLADPNFRQPSLCSRTDSSHCKSYQPSIRTATYPKTPRRLTKPRSALSVYWYVLSGQILYRLEARNVRLGQYNLHRRSRSFGFPFHSASGEAPHSRDGSRKDVNERACVTASRQRGQEVMMHCGSANPWHYLWTPITIGTQGSGSR